MGHSGRSFRPILTSPKARRSLVKHFERLEDLKDWEVLDRCIWVCVCQLNCSECSCIIMYQFLLLHVSLVPRSLWTKLVKLWPFAAANVIWQSRSGYLFISVASSLLTLFIRGTCSKICSLINLPFCRSKWRFGRILWLINNLQMPHR